MNMETDDHDKNESASSLQKHRISDSSEQYEPDQDSDQQQIQVPTPSQIRSYECTFCKRGFSNAQALGGHMNIHRKHKAKLKLEETTHRQQQLYSPSTHEDPDTPTKSTWPWNVVPYKEHDQDKTSTVAPGDREKEEWSSVDLELRLGPEPNKDSKDTTRKFF